MQPGELHDDLAASVVSLDREKMKKLRLMLSYLVDLVPQTFRLQHVSEFRMPFNWDPGYERHEDYYCRFAYAHGTPAIDPASPTGEHYSANNPAPQNSATKNSFDFYATKNSVSALDSKGKATPIDPERDLNA